MERTEDFYWVKGYKWSDEARWFIAHWTLGSWWSDGDDFDDNAFNEIDETPIVRWQKNIEQQSNCNIQHVSGLLPISDDEYKKVTNLIYHKDNSKKFRRQ
jgi:hypothetical protein